jgi:GcrA cell cycle regulator
MSAWTQDRIKLLKRLWPEGLSAETIARELGGGLTRNAVLGKVARLGLSEARTDARPRREGAHRDTPEPPPAPAPAQPAPPPPAPPPPALPPSRSTR